MEFNSKKNRELRQQLKEIVTKIDSVLLYFVTSTVPEKSHFETLREIRQLALDVLVEI